MRKARRSRRIVWVLAAALCALAQPSPHAAAMTEVQLVKDIVPGRGSPHILSAVDVGGTLYFRALSGEDFGIWKTDGTEAGTVRVKDIDCADLMSVGSTLFFTATDRTHGWELWRSDGTEEGTIMVKDIQPDRYYPPRFLTDVDGTLFFFADDGEHGNELWKSDGSAAGTVMVKDITPGPEGSSTYDMANVSGTLFFDVYSGDGESLWKSDGTEAGTVMVKEVAVQYLTPVGDMAFFSGIDANHRGWGLWKSDGTAVGTRQVKALPPGIGPEEIVDAAGTVYFVPGDQAGEMSTLWKSDGTTAGTVRVAAFSSPNGSYVGGLTALGTTVYFVAPDARHGYELWKSDGTAAGTGLVKDITPGPDSTSIGQRGRGARLVAVDGALYFGANDGADGSELWTSDGTRPGTTMARDLNVGTRSSNPSKITGSGASVFFAATSRLRGRELWVLQSG